MWCWLENNSSLFRICLFVHYHDHWRYKSKSHLFQSFLLISLSLLRVVFTPSAERIENDWKQSDELQSKKPWFYLILWSDQTKKESLLRLVKKINMISENLYRKNINLNPSYWDRSILSPRCQLWRGSTVLYLLLLNYSITFHYIY